MSDKNATCSSLQGMQVHPVLTLVNQCDELARRFDRIFQDSCTLLTNVANGQPAGEEVGSLDQVLMRLRETLDQCEQVVAAMLACIYEDIPHLLDQLDQATDWPVVANFNPKLALDSISQLFYSYQEVLLEKRELLADFTCEEISPAQFVHRWTSIDTTLSSQRKQQVDDLADLLAAF